MNRLFSLLLFAVACLCAVLAFEAFWQHLTCKGFGNCGDASYDLLVFTGLLISLFAMFTGAKLPRPIKR